MRAVAVALLLEEQRGEILDAWRRQVERELGGEPALAFAIGPLLREMALALRGDGSLFAGGVTPSGDAGARCAVLVRSGAGAARVAREFKLLHRTVWQVVKQAGAVVGADERRAGDEWLDEALAAALDRLDRVRARAELFDPTAVPAPPPPPAAPPRARSYQEAAARAVAQGRSKPPPLPRPAAARAVALPPVVPARPPPLPHAPRPAPAAVVAADAVFALD
ncbi:MAG TPA: hypothetical protein VFL83_20485 [Anaeromyxobacter sp.]|nr:hypothetical protein [Anaeromyxobacter sp.]